MSVSILELGASVDVAPGALQVTWSTDPGSGPVAVLARGDDGETTDGVQRLGSDRLLLLAVTGPVEFVARPAHGSGPLPPGTRLRLELAVLAGGTPTAQVVLPARDLSGTRDEVLVRVLPLTAARWSVVAPEVSVDEEPPLPDLPLARAATYATRRLSSAVGRLPPARRRELVVALDVSASMAQHARSGAVQSLLEVVLGVNAVVGSAPTVPVWTVGHRPERLPVDLGNASADGYVSDVLGGRPVTTSSALLPLLQELGLPAARPEVVLVTDGPPGDVAALGAALPAAPAALHVLALGQDARHAPKGRPWTDEFGALRPLVDERRVTVSTVAPEDEPGWLARRLEDAAVVEDLVARLEIAADHLAAADGGPS